MMQKRLQARTIAIASGKGGVGKSCITANLACSLALAGKRVLVLDGDLGLANMDILLNLQPTGTLHDVLQGSQTLAEVLLTGPAGVRVLPSGSGLAEYAQLSGDARERLPRLLSEIVDDFDYILTDTGAGISEVVMFTASLAQEVLIVATPEATSFTDAYATIKVMATQHGRTHFSMAINQVRKGQSGERIAGKLQQTADQFLEKQLGRRIVLSFAGEIPADPEMEAAVRARTPAVVRDPRSPAAVALHNLAGALARQKQTSLGLREPGGELIPG